MGQSLHAADARPVRKRVNTNSTHIAHTSQTARVVALRFNLGIVRVLTLPLHRSPTLIYTHSLEKRIKELEAEVADLRQGRKTTKSPDPRTPESSQLRDDSSSSKPRRFDGLKLDDKGVTTYHGSTSFFHFLDGLGHTPSSADGETERDRDESKQSLKHNAWQQRAIELNSQVPVRPSVNRSTT
jgi:hypothetical protein